MVVREREPRLAGEPDVARVELVADLVERQRTLADEPAVDARTERSLALSPQAPADERSTRMTPSMATTMATRRLEPDRAVGEDEGQDAGGERADREEDREERRAGQLQHEERQRGDEPDRVDRHERPSVKSAARV